MAQAPYALLRRYGASAIRAARRGYCPGGAIRRFGLAIAPRGNTPNPSDSRIVRQ